MSFPFIERTERLARRFKIAILAFTSALILLVLGLSSDGRNVVSWLAIRTRWVVSRTFGVEPSRAEIDRDWQRRRLHDIEQATGKLKGIYDEYSPGTKRLFDHAGLDPEHALLRWGNFDKTIYLPSTIFEADDTGRSYRFRPNVESIWVRNLVLKGGILAYFPIPVTDQLETLAKEAGAEIITTSQQTTNSWGLRGPEPNLTASLKGIILGDSYMQGLFVEDGQTPSECLKRELSQRMGVTTEILNTGHMGYSPEQEYFTLREYAGRFPADFVVLSLFANDFGDLFEVLDGKGDWTETKHWLDQITNYCQANSLLLLVVPAPWVNQIEDTRKTGFYPGLVCNLIGESGTHYLDPIDTFADESLRQRAKRLAEGKPVTPNPLFNGHVGDGHFSPIGCELWAGVVAERLQLLIENQRAMKSPATKPK